MMTSIVFTATGVPPVAEGVQATPANAARADAFADALARQSGQADAATAAAAPAQAASADLDAQTRARRGLGLDGTGRAEGTATDGDMILDGLQRLRGVFDAREARVSEMMNRTTLDANTMIAVQMEMTNFTLLVDITSKLTGKSTQAFDTLMKGQ